MAATALAALLMIAVLAVTTSLARSGVVLSTAARADTWSAGLIDLIRWDLLQAQSVQTGTSHLTLQGYSALAPRTLSPTHRPVSVSYQLQTIGKQSWLVRRQTNLDQLTSHNAGLELVCAGVASFELKALEENASGGPEGASPPRGFRLLVRPVDAAAPPIDTRLWIR